MKKGNIMKLITFIFIGALVFTGCTSGLEKESTLNGEAAYIIGVNQLVEHPSLDEARLGFEDGLKELGVNAKVIYQNAQGDIPTSLSIAQKFVKDQVDLIYAIATPAVQSSKQATTDIPILFSAVTDPVQSEVVADWNRVGGNITGTSDAVPTAAQLQMFKEMDPSIKTIGILYNTSESNSDIQIAEVKNLAPAEGLEVVTVGITNVNELPQALDSILKKVDALYLISDNTIATSVQLISKTLIENNKISIASFASAVDEGILITNGLSYYELGKQTAKMAKEILVDGKDVSEIPVELSERTIITVNEKTREALGLDPTLPVFKNAIKVEK
ncbi:ABC transporter substrate-binding protein [Alkaliphilus oremlandii]|uniref:ABC transporter substrate binding protein n=1 Tax=Alkaliphilus oremlandii (strain OhILAs) TaxID=350688 RepID=A8MKA4_ALKOO|nr:ABC transporter substrate-binding protein [Alkaliphilus oremlandii]ABW20236.1 protein of unknown function DUF534 [Alkaliphilus oremlandii OhILAs]